MCRLWECLKLHEEVLGDSVPLGDSVLRCNSVPLGDCVPLSDSVPFGDSVPLSDSALLGDYVPLGESVRITKYCWDLTRWLRSYETSRKNKFRGFKV